MPMNYTETSASVFKNEWFKDRVRISVSSYVNYLLNTDAADPEYAAKIAHANKLSTMYESVVSNLMFVLSGDSEVIAGGVTIPDATLQLIVEKNIAKLYPMTPVIPPPTGFSVNPGGIANTPTAPPIRPAS